MTDPAWPAFLTTRRTAAFYNAAMFPYSYVASWAGEGEICSRDDDGAIAPKQPFASARHTAPRRVRYVWKHYYVDDTPTIETWADLFALKYDDLMSRRQVGFAAVSALIVWIRKLGGKAPRDWLERLPHIRQSELMQP